MYFVYWNGKPILIFYYVDIFIESIRRFDYFIKG